MPIRIVTTLARYEALPQFADALDIADHLVARGQPALRVPAIPTPAGVPVKMMSPGSSVTNGGTASR